MLRPGRLTLSAKPASDGIGDALEDDRNRARRRLRRLDRVRRRREDEVDAQLHQLGGQRRQPFVRPSAKRSTSVKLRPSRSPGRASPAETRQRRLDVGAGVGAEDADDLGRSLGARARCEQRDRGGEQQAATVKHRHAFRSRPWAVVDRAAPAGPARARG
jgi:hypothetical protein